MLQKCRPFHLPRRGNTSEQYEDAHAADETAGCYAVADGASESAFARQWAMMLVDGFVKDPPSDLEDWTDGLPMLQQRWVTAIGSGPLPYYVKPKFLTGAFATFLGVKVALVEGREFEWRAVAVGDTCVFHTRQSQLLCAFPLAASKEFNNQPRLVGSRTAPDQVRRDQRYSKPRRALPGDRLWLMTDALAQWSLGAYEAGENPCQEMELHQKARRPGARMTAWWERLRDTGRLRNDDVTLLAIRL